MKSAVPVHKVLRLPRALQRKVLKVLRLPRNLQFQCAKRRSCHKACHWRCSKCCAGHEICTSSAPSAAPATKFATEGAQSAAPATKSAHPDSHRAALPRRFAVAGAALCERIFFLILIDFLFDRIQKIFFLISIYIYIFFFDSLASCATPANT